MTDASKTANKNGVDKLNIADVGALSGYSEDFLESDESLVKWAERSVSGEWDLTTAKGLALAKAAFKQTQWYVSNGEQAQLYLTAKAEGGQKFTDLMASSSEMIRNTAERMGAVLTPDQVNGFVTAYNMNGWGAVGKEDYLEKALSGQLPAFNTNFMDFTKGGPDALITKMRGAARLNGVDYNESFFQGKATRILSGDASLEDVYAEMRQMAAGADPVNAARILGGESRRDIYSPYILTYAKMFDRDPNGVNLDDKNVKLAFNSLNEKGQPGAMGLWDYEKALRKTDEWAYTRDAQDRVGSLTGKIVSMFGFGSQ